MSLIGILIRKNLKIINKQRFLEYISMTREEFDGICDKFRPNHIWKKNSNRWELKTPLENDQIKKSD